MFRKYYILLALILALTGLLFLSQGKIKNPLNKERALISVSPLRVTRIEIFAKDKKTTLEKKSGKWLIVSLNDFPAKSQEIVEFLEKIAIIKNPEVVSINPKKQEVYEVTEKKGIKVIFYERENKKQEIIFGKTGPSFSGVYFRIGGKNEVYLTDVDLRNFLTLDDFRDLTILKTNSERVKKLTFKTYKTEFTLSKKSLKDKKEIKWYLNGKEVNEGKVMSYLTTLSTLVAKDAFLDKKAEETGLGKPQFMLIIEEDGSPTKNLKVGNIVKQEENPDYYLNLNDSSVIYTIPSTVFSDLQKTETDFQSS